MGRAASRRRRGLSGGVGNTTTSSPGGVNRGPRHGHGNKGKGGGNSYGSNNINMTIGQAKKIYANQLAEGISLQDAMRHNKAETVRFSDLLDDQGDTKQSNSNTPHNSTNNNNTMTAQSDSDWLNQQYLSKFGRTADTNSAGGAGYWLRQMAANPTSHSRQEVARMLGASSEGTAYNDPTSATYGVVSPGGVDRSGSTYGQADNEYLQSIRNLGLNNANVLNTIAGNSFLAGADGTASTDNVAGNYFQISDDELLNMGGGGNNNNVTLPGQPVDGWWSQFADADAFKDFLFGGQQDDGMGDFMKFMMLMSVMGGGRGMGGGGGYGGSQYGYGGLNPGGVQAAYDPMQHLTGMGDWFKTNFGSGSGSGATTSTVNAT